MILHKKIFKISLIVYLIIFFVFPRSIWGQSMDERNKVREEVRKELKQDDINTERVLVRYKKGISEEEIQATNLKYNQQKQSILKSNDEKIVQTVYRADGQSLEDLMVAYKLDPNVESVNVVHKGKLLAWTDPDSPPQGTRLIPGDFDTSPSYTTGNQWYYSKIKLPELWKDQNCDSLGGVSPCGGNSSVIVAVIDSGVAFENYDATYEWYGTEYGNPTPIHFAQATELNGINLWTNPVDTGTHLDEDGNGICDDVHGVDMEIVIENGSHDTWDCATSADTQKEGHPNDDYGHGTFVSGIIASLTDNGASSVSIAHNITLMPIKVNVPFTGDIWEDSFYWAVVYAVDHGASVINVSLGWSSDASGYLKDAMDYAEAHGVIVVAAAGNGGREGLTYPAQLSNSNVIAVGAVNADNTKSSYSNYGTRLDLVAPVGQGGSENNAAFQQTLDCAWSCSSSSNYSTFKDAYAVGTSFAAPQVSAGAALLKSRIPGLNIGDTYSILTSTTTDIGSSGWDQTTGYGILNLEGLWNQGYFINTQKVHDYFAPAGTIPGIGDFNNDGYDDLVTFTNDAAADVWISINNAGSGFLTPTKVHDYFAPAGTIPGIGDFNNDGYDDLVTFTNDTAADVWISINNSGSGFLTPMKVHDYFAPAGTVPGIGDFNNDGYDDLVTFTKGNSSDVWVSLSLGSYFSSVQKWHDWFCFRDDIPLVGDFDGNGRDDIVSFTNDYAADVWIALSN
jgi:hypothetical protein